MLTVYGGGTSRSLRVTWLLEEMGVPYRMRAVDLLHDIENDTEFWSVNPAGYIPVLTDGDVTVVESIAIMEYVMARHGPTELAPPVMDAAFPLHQQFLHLGEAGLSMPVYICAVVRHLAPEDQRDNWSVRHMRETYRSRLGLVTRQLQKTPYLAGERFTAADISVAHALGFAGRVIGELGPVEREYLDRVTARDGYQKALAVSQDAIRGPV